MSFKTDAVAPADFAAWVARTKAAGPVLDAAAYDKLGVAEGNIAPFTYRAVMPNFYRFAVAHAVAPQKTVNNGREERKNVR